MIPMEIEIKNFFSHKDSRIDFTQFDSALLIGNVDGNYDISNGSGKSALFEAILWCLFNKSRAASMDDIIYWGENLCEVTLTFRHGGVNYRVIRQRSRINSTASVTFLRQDDGGSWIDISGSTSSLTNKNIIKTIHLDHKTFVNSAYFRQNDISEFAETDASRKKGILKSIIDLSKWDEYEKLAKSNLRDLKVEYKLLESRLTEHDELEESFKLAEEAMKASRSGLKEKVKERALTKTSLETMTKRYQEIKSTLDTDRWDKVVQNLKSLSKKKVGVENKLASTDYDILKFERMISAVEVELSSLKRSIETLESDPDVEGKIKEVRQKTIELESNKNVSAELLKALEERDICKGRCYVCNQDIDEDLYNSLLKEHEEERLKHEQTKVYCQNKLNELLIKRKKLEIIFENNKKIARYKDRVEAKSIESDIAMKRVSELNTLKKTLSLKLEEIVEDITLSKSILDSIRNDDFRSLHENIIELKADYQRLNDLIEKRNLNLGALTEKTSNLKDKISSLKSIRKLSVEKKKEMIILEKMVKFLGKNGIQTILLNAVIEDLESSSNEILTSICNEPFTIYLDTQRVGSDGVSVVDTLDLKVKKDGIVQNFKSLSGGEKFRISLALRIALSEISSRHGGSSLEFLLLDEVNSPLDRHGTESLFVNVIKALEKRYKILVITHNDTLKEKFSNIIDVSKVNGESSINFIAI